MYRFLALLCAVLLTCITVTSAGLAANVGPIRFQLATQRSAADRVQLTITEHNDGGLTSSSFGAAQLAGLNRAALIGPGPAPLRFALARDAGRLDCIGSGRNGAAAGTCRFAPDAGFSDLLASRGIQRPNERQAFALTMAGASRALVDALAKARYQVPTLDQLTGLAALGVSPAYIDELAARGYRPTKLDDLMSFKALDISPAYIDRMSRSGFPGLSADHIVQFKALGISPEYVRAMQAAGYGRLSAGELVQLKALGVTPAFIAGFERLGYRLPAARLIEFKALGVTPEFVRSLRQDGAARISADELIKLKLVGLLP